jgi:hypothetical protein
LSRSEMSERRSRLKSRQVSVEGEKYVGWQSTSDFEFWILRIQPQRQSNNPWSRRGRWDQLRSLPGDLNRKFVQVPHCREVCSTTLDKVSKAVACKRVLSYKRLTRSLWFHFVYQTQNENEGAMFWNGIKSDTRQH